MAKCKHETKNGRCGLKESYAYRNKCYTEECCRCHEPIEPCGRNEQMTNADRIRAMSDEELANTLWDVGLDIWNCNEYNGQNVTILPQCEKCDGNCESVILKWLKQPAKEE